jgi:hypothetical protein
VAHLQRRDVDAAFFFIRHDGGCKGILPLSIILVTMTPC